MNCIEILRNTPRQIVVILGLSMSVLVSLSTNLQAEDAGAMVKAAVDYYRGNASFSVVDMTVHRPNWERTMSIKAWTKGRETSLFFITAPPKDKGNGTLKRGHKMWTYNPKVNRVIKLPPSMMSQSWMGSDFSNNDLAKSDTILKDYTHTIEATKTDGPMKVYIVKSIPKPRAPVVWGMQRLTIREDHILLGQEFYDEDLKLVKSMTSAQIQMLGGRLFPKVWKMQKADKADSYTLLEYRELEFKEDLPDHLFTQSSLRARARTSLQSWRSDLVQIWPIKLSKTTDIASYFEDFAN